MFVFISHKQFSSYAIYVYCIYASGVGAQIKQELSRNLCDNIKGGKT